MAETYTELAGLARRCNKIKIVLPEIQRDKVAGMQQALMPYLTFIPSGWLLHEQNKHAAEAAVHGCVEMDNFE
jgi:hypothetical protein